MARRVYARRYAQAVFEIALEKEELDRWQSDLKKIASVGEDEVLLSVLESPKLSFDDKARLLSERLGKISPLAQNMAHLLVARGRFSMAGDIADAYRELLNTYRGIEEAQVVTAVPLGDEDRKNLGKRLANLTGKKVVLESEADSSVIGGVMVRIGGKLIDGSTRSKLEALKRELVGAGR